MDVKNVPLSYRPIPFWSWNEKLDTEETARQVRLMHQAGIGGFFMHARGGLETPYLGEEWFENVEAAIAEAEKLGMRPWAYDENGWPSGFGDGIVNGLGVEYQQKYLRMADANANPDNYICTCGDHAFYYEINPFYVDTLDAKVTAKFLEVAYAPYYERFGTRIEGFFTDEPQISRDGIPWSFVFKEEYEKRYGLDIYTELESLFLPVGDYENVRIRFWKMVTDLFSAAYMKQIYDWCDDRGLKLTGHLVCEETPRSQLVTNGACMPHYEYFHLPGMDWLSRKVPDRQLTTAQLNSACAQLGKKEVISETFAGSGHNVSFDELKGMYQRHMAEGVNLLCPHLEGYSIRGLRKRDWPPAMYYQQPWWDEYKHWVDAMSRVGMILRESTQQADVLLLHPQTTAWAAFNGDMKEPQLQQIQDKLFDDMRLLWNRHIPYHLGDETLMERHGRVENGKLIIGNCSYSTVIEDCCRVLLPNTERLLAEFKAQGGKIVTAKDLVAAPFMAENSIFCTQRVLNGQNIYYFTNPLDETVTVKIDLCGKVMDIYTGEFTVFTGEHTFAPYGCLMLFEEDIPHADKVQTTPAYLGDVFKVSPHTENAMTLDKCDYYFDGVLQQEKGYVLNITNRACALERPVHIRQEFKVQVNAAPEKLYLVMETPELFSLSINEKTVEKRDLGAWVDPSFRKIDISGLLQAGENVITLECDFRQSPEVYENIRKSFQFESEKNKLRYDMEVEPIYLLGSFGVATEGTWEETQLNSAFYDGKFVLEALPETVSVKHMERQGFPFFCGKLELEGTVTVTGENPVLSVRRRGVNVLRVQAEGVDQTLITGTDIDLTGLAVGEHKVNLTLTNNLRNLLGPHHYMSGDPVGTSPALFHGEKCVWAPNFGNTYWKEEYNFVETSL